MFNNGALLYAVKLTQTEQRVVELYSAGLKPREIANRLGISVNTVYKALSKHRRISEASAEAPQSRPSAGYYAVVTPLYSSSVVYTAVYAPQPSAAEYDELKALVKRLGDLLDKLEKLVGGGSSLGAPRRTPVSVGASASAGPEDGDGSGLPDFIRRNIWVKVLRGANA